MSGKGGGTTTVQQADPWEGAQPYLRDVYARAQGAADRTSTAAYGGNFVTPGNDTQRSGWEALRGLAGDVEGLGGSTRALGESMLRGDYLNNNPYLTDAINATVRPAVTAAREQIMPAISSRAQAAGAYGGSRHGLIQARAASDVDQAVADTAAKMWNENYGRERTLQSTVAPGLVQSGATMDMLAPQLLTQAGGLERDAAALLDQNNLARFEDEINRYWRPINPYVAALGGVGMPGGTTTSTSNGGSSPLAGALSGAAGGAGLMAMAGGANMLPAALSGPWGLAGAALLGGLLGGIR